MRRQDGWWASPGPPVVQGSEVLNGHGWNPFGSTTQRDAHREVLGGTHAMAVTVDTAEMPRDMTFAGPIFSLNVLAAWFTLYLAVQVNNLYRRITADDTRIATRTRQTYYTGYYMLVFMHAIHVVMWNEHVIHVK